MKSDKVIAFPRRHQRGPNETTEYGRRWHLAMLLTGGFAEWLVENGDFTAGAFGEELAGVAHANLMLAEMPPDDVAELHHEVFAMPRDNYGERRAQMLHIMMRVLNYAEEDTD